MQEYITSLRFLDNGAIFPPTKCSLRLKQYTKYNKFYKGDYKATRITQKTAQGTKTINWVQPKYNYYKMITDKQLALITKEKPVIKADTPENTKLLNSSIEDVGFITVLEEVLKSYSSLGDGVFFLEKLDSEVYVNAVNPANVIKVVSPTNINRTVCHVLYNVIYEESYDTITTEEKIVALHVMIHYPGYYVERFYSYDNNRIGHPILYDEDKDLWVSDDRKLSEVKSIKTGLKGSAVYTVHNSKAIDEVYGISDYVAIEDAIKLIEKKTAQYDLITDKHTDPIFQTSKGTGKTNERTGKADYEVFGNIIFPKKDDIESKYITWDGNLEQLLSFIDKQKEAVAELSEFGSVFFKGDFGNVSGESIKSMAQSILAKVSRVIDSIDFVVKSICCEMLASKGIILKPSSISIQWQDGLPNDSMLTQAQALQYKKQVGVISTYRALTDYEGLTPEQANEELIRIGNDSAKGVKYNGNMGKNQELVDT